MSDNDSSGAESDSDLPPEETLVHGRARRSTAGNRLSYLLQHLEDEDIRKYVRTQQPTPSIHLHTLLSYINVHVLLDVYTY